MHNKFTHLHLHTEFSFLDGMTRVWDVAAKEAGELITRLKEIGQDSCAITDHGSTAGWVRFEKACAKNGIKPILGVEGYYCNNRKLKGLTPEQKLVAERGCSTAKEKKEAHKRLESKLGLNRRSHFCSWAMNKKGCYEILATMSTAARDGFYNKPRWDWPLIKVMDNCLFSSACMGGILGWEAINVIEGKAPKSLWPEAKERAWEEARKWKGLLGDRFYIEMMAIDMKQQVKMNELMWAISKDLEIPMIITNDPHYARPEDWEAHDILLAINSTRFDKLGDALTSNNRLRYDAHDLYIKSYQEMYDSFTQRNPKIPEEVVRQALSTTQDVAARCNPDSLIKGKMIMPKLDIPENADHDEKEAQKLHLLKLCKEGWKRKVLPYVKTRAGLIEYRERLEEELGLITNQGFTPYFILCNKLMKWVDAEKLERGPARGSSCGSLVAYLLDITMIDPIPHKLLFSRFIDPNRTDYPDVDMDFEDRRRREVVQYFINNYGNNNVAILGNNMVFKPKMALKDVSRLYHVPLKEVQELCNLVIERSGADSRLSFCLEDTFDQHEFAKEFARKYPLVKQYAAKLEGTVKNSGVHAAGVIIADGDIRKYTSLRKDKKSDFPVSTIDKNDAEDVGLLKMDVLGLNTMTILNEAKRYIQQRHGLWIGLEDLVKDVTYTGGDPDVYQSFSDANTVGVFQFGSPGLTRLAKQVKIERFSEVSDCTALHRPGPIHSGAMAKYPALKFGKGTAEVAEHEVIARWTQDTYGLIIYQEQVMQIVRELGDFDWAQTNTVRKVMSKSGGAEYFMKTFWPQWKKGCNEKGMDDATAEKAFKRIMSFGSWAFNKSHSIAYAFVSYFCMWFKVHYPLEYCTAYLNTVSGDIDNKIKEMIKEVVRLGIELREPDINISKHKFVIDEKAIVAGLSNIKNVGEKAIQAIIDKQPFTDIMDFMERVDSRACNKRSVENLIKAGAFDRFGYDKKKLLENLELIHKNVKKKIAKGTTEARRLLAECMGEETFTGQEEAEMKSSVSPITVGKHLSEYYEDVEKAFGPHINLKRLNEIIQDEGEQQKDRTETKRVDVLIRGVLTSVDLKRLSQEVTDVIDETKEQRYALANLEDETDFIVLSFKNEIYTRYEQKLYPWRGKVLLIRGSVNIGWKKVFVDSVFEMDELRAYLNRGRMPLNFAYDYLFQHPLHRYFSKVGGVGTVRKKYGCRPLKYLARIRKGESMWAVGLITDIHTFTAKRGQSAGQDFYWVFFEDETFQGSFMVFPGDKRFKAMRMELFTLYENKSPFLLQVQRDMKFDPNKMEFKQVSISIDKRKEWGEMIKKPFKFKVKPVTEGGEV